MTGQGRGAPPSTLQDYADLLSKVGLFAGLDRVTLAKLAGHLEPVPVQQGDPVVTQGGTSDAFFLASHGAFGVYARSNGVDVRISTIGRGGPIGEMGLLTGGVRSATVVAVMALIGGWSNVTRQELGLQRSTRRCVQDRHHASEPWPLVEGPEPRVVMASSFRP